MKILVLLCAMFCVVGTVAFAQIQIDSVDRDPANVTFVDDQLLLPDGSASEPSYSFLNAPDMGFYKWSPNHDIYMGVAFQGLLRYRLGPNAIWMGTNNFSFGTSSNSVDTQFRRIDPGILSVWRGPDPQEFRIYNTDDLAGNTEYGFLSWQKQANYFIMGTGASGTGSSDRSFVLNPGSNAYLIFRFGGANRWSMSSAGSYFGPEADNLQDFGRTALRLKTIYTYDLDAADDITAGDQLAGAKVKLTPSAKGTCDSASDGTIHYEIVANVGTLYLCRQTGASSYAWTALH